MKKRLGILGSGIVGVTLANGLKGIYSDVTVANRKGVVVDGWSGEVGAYEEVAKNSDIIILAVKGAAAEDVIKKVRNWLVGKTVIDTTNPIADAAPDEGVLSYFTTLDHSLMERLQTIAPEAGFVKAFNSIGNALMINPSYKEGRPTMFICGNDPKAKDEVTKLLVEIGWDAEDMGGVKSARALEPLCILWCLPGMLRNEWTHAFKLLRSN